MIKGDKVVVVVGWFVVGGRVVPVAAVMVLLVMELVVMVCSGGTEGDGTDAGSAVVSADVAPESRSKIPGRMAAPKIPGGGEPAPCPPNDQRAKASTATVPAPSPQPTGEPLSRRPAEPASGESASCRPTGHRAARSDDGAGQFAAVSPEQHSSWLTPNIGQDPSRQAA
jgi:hypothetical protein